jgi:ABC-2 type transport system ATP-binding protein
VWTKPAFALEQVVVRYGDFPALDGVSFGAPRGTITGLVGRNGAGKSTTIRLLAGLLEPQAGTVSVVGRTFGDDGAEIRRSVGYLLDTPALFSYLTAEETLLFVAEAYGLSPAERTRRTEELLSFFGLHEARHRVADDFSTGMRKRLALACAVVHSPGLLVLDEPFESLDPLMVRRLKDLLTRYRSAGGSVLLSSHLIDAVEEIADRIVIMERGRVVVSGSTQVALAQAASRLPNSTLEELYLSVVEEDAPPPLGWLAP